jgi:hypothetical protein
VIEGGLRRVDGEKVEGFAKMKRLRLGKEVVSLLGFVGYLRDYIPFAAEVLAPLEGMRKMRVISEKSWEEGKGEETVEMLKKVLGAGLVLQEALEGYEFRLGTDASQNGVGVVVYQIV